MLQALEQMIDGDLAVDSTITKISGRKNPCLVTFSHVFSKKSHVGDIRLCRVVMAIAQVAWVQKSIVQPSKSTKGDRCNFFEISYWEKDMTRHDFFSIFSTEIFSDD